MAEFNALKPLAQPRRAAELTPEAQYYKAFKQQWKQKESSRVVGLAFSPLAPHKLAVVSGTKVGVWQGNKEGEAQDAGVLSKFKDLTQCVAWRADGKLALAGEAGGSCAVIEMDTRKVLRRFRGHGDAVTCATFASADRTKAATGSRDGKLRIWDVTTSELLVTLDAHSDVMKVVCPGPGGPDGWITAGYDGKVKLWDLSTAEAEKDDKGASKKGATLTGGCVVTVDHGHPVEAGVVFPGGALFASAGGQEVKIWDLAAGGRLVQTLADAHSKVITAVCLDSSASLLLTASFDGLAKVHRAATLEHLWSYRLPGPATCAAWRADSKAFAIGLDDGQWMTREFKTPPSGAAEAEAAQKKKTWTAKFGSGRGFDSKPNEDDDVVESGRQKKQKRTTYLDHFFKKFEYRKVVEFILEPQVDAVTGLAAIDELLQRGALESALHELGEDLCLSVLRWLLKVMTTGDALHQQLVLETLHTMLDSNKCLQPPCTAPLVDAVAKLENKVNQELRVQELLMETAGMLKTVTAS